MKRKLIEKDLSYSLTGICFKLHNELGRFLTEKQYADALEKQFEREGVSFTREPSLKTEELSIGRPDFVIE